MARAFPGTIVCSGVLVRGTDAELVVEPFLKSLPRWTAPRSVFIGASPPTVSLAVQVRVSGVTIMQIRRLGATARNALRHTADEGP